MSARIEQLIRSASRYPNLWRGLALSLLINVDAAAQNTFSATVAWNASTSTNVAGYKVYYGTHSGVYTNIVVVSATTTSLQLADLPAATTYFVAVKTVSPSGAQSAFSAEVYFATPSAPTLSTQAATDVYGEPFVEVVSPIPSRRYWRLDYSLDLNDWSPLDQSEGYGESVDVLVPVSDDPNLAQMFFRVAVY